MLNWTKSQLEEIGAEITTREIMQQPELWGEAYAIYEEHKSALTEFITNFSKEQGKKIRVIFTGAGTSAYVGDVVRPHLIENGDTNAFQFEAIPTTDIVAAPHSYLKADEPTLLVSFARSGNSPESLVTVDLANQLVKNVKHLMITCAPEGKLATNHKADENAYVVLAPARSNDQGFAMTGSFTSMTLLTLLTFDMVTKNKKEIIEQIVAMGEQVRDKEEQLQELVDQDFNRVVYLGSGSLSGLTREAQLKLLELTAGKITTVFDSSMGFRHGPKSFVDEKTLAFGFISSNAYTQKYDIDILEEIKGNEIATSVVAIAQNQVGYSGQTIDFGQTSLIPDAYAVLPYVMIAQVIALFASIKVANKPDTPSPTGTVNRVVKGVIIHEL